MTQTEQAIRARLSNVRAYFDATWATRELAEPTASELIWVLTGEEGMGGMYLDREYEPPTQPEDQSLPICDGCDGPPHEAGCIYGGRLCPEPQCTCAVSPSTGRTFWDDQCPAHRSNDSADA